MLSPADEAVLARDPGLPGLRWLFDDEALLEALRLARPNLGARALRVENLRYKPGTSCLAAFEIETARGPLPAYAKAFARGSGSRSLDRERERAAAADLGDEALWILEEAGIAVLFFPHDAKLPLLRRTEDPAAFEEISRRALGDHPELWNGSFERLRYKPERRFVCRLTGPEGGKVEHDLFA